jgi:hypothetical protein
MRRIVSQTTAEGHDDWSRLATSPLCPSTLQTAESYGRMRKLRERCTGTGIAG